MLSQTYDLLASLIVLLAWHNSPLFIEEGSFFTFSQPMFSLLTHREKLEIIGCIFCLILHMCDSHKKKTNTLNEDCIVNFRMGITDFLVYSITHLLIHSKIYVRCCAINWRSNEKFTQILSLLKITF